ncbi:MAG TPA: DUF748 domain-containing protein [Candidatus Omnitrophota bacterium]|nr:DUF748 domain-containing protein [Candidatus Omnitrophota bacterium]HPT07315.1 DUF748 domain-containing protein [Candidatus Omnitrophota bacterium]
MKTWVKVFIAVVLVFTLLFCSLYFYLTIQGRQLITQLLEDRFHEKTSIGYFAVVPPFRLLLKDFAVGNIIKADSVFASPSVIGLITGSFIFDDVIVNHPYARYEYGSQAQQPAASSETNGTVAQKTAPATSETGFVKKPFRFSAKRVTINDGTFEVVNRAIGDTGIAMKFTGITFHLRNLYSFSRSFITNFDLKAKIPWRQGKESGTIDASGWINLFKKDIEAKIRVANIDALYLYPYYALWVNLDKARIEKAKLNFQSDIHGRNNAVSAACHLELVDIGFKKEEEAGRVASIMEKALDQGKVVVNFTFKTKMDKPEFGFGSIKMAFENEKPVQSEVHRVMYAGDVLQAPAWILQGFLKVITAFSRPVADTFSVYGKKVRRIYGAD